MLYVKIFQHRLDHATFSSKISMTLLITYPICSLLLAPKIFSQFYIILIVYKLYTVEYKA